MIGYLILFIIILSVDHIKNKQIQLVLVFLVISIFSGIRYGLGFDYYSYLNCCYKGSYGGLRFEFIPLQMVILSQNTFPYLFFLLTSLFISFFYYEGIKRAGKDYILETIFYVCFPLLFYDHLGIIRQGMATAAVFYAISLYDINGERTKRKTLFLRVVLIIMAVLCHKSALVAVLILLPWEKMPNLVLWIMFISSFFLGFIVAPIVETMFDTELFDFIDEERTMYLLQIDGENSHIRQYMIYGLTIISLLSYEKLKMMDRKNTYFIAILTFGASLYALLPGSSSLSKRICMLFFVSAILVIPQIVKLCKVPRAIYISVMIGLFSYQVYLGSRIQRLEDSEDSSVSYPYRTYIPFLSKDINL